MQIEKSQLYREKRHEDRIPEHRYFIVRVGKPAVVCFRAPREVMGNIPQFRNYRSHSRSRLTLNGYSSKKHDIYEFLCIRWIYLVCSSILIYFINSKYVRRNYKISNWNRQIHYELLLWFPGQYIFPRDEEMPNWNKIQAQRKILF